MQELFSPSYERLTTAPLPLKPEQAALCIQKLSNLVETRPDNLTDLDMLAIKSAFVAGYSAFAAGTDDYSSLDLAAMRVLCNNAFVYTKDMLVAMLKQATPIKYTKEVGSLFGQTPIYYAGVSEDGETMFSIDQVTQVSMSSLIAMSN